MIGNRIFNGMYPRLSARLLPPEGALLAENCWLDRGTPRAVPEPRATTISVPSTTRTLFRYDTNRFFRWRDDVDAVRAPVFSDTRTRVIWSGEQKAGETEDTATVRHTSTQILSSFSSPGIPFSRILGVPAPRSMPTVQLGDAPANTMTDEDDEDADPQAGQTALSSSYVYTWVTDHAEEGPPSPPSPAVDRAINDAGTIQTATVSIPQDFPSGRGINLWRLYRTSGAAFSLVAQGNARSSAVPFAYADSMTDSQLPGGTLVSEDWDPPPDGLKGLQALYNGVLAGFKGRDIHFSVPYQPHAWPEDYIVTLDAEIVGMAAYGVNLVVGTTGKPYLVSGNDPSVVAVQQLELDQPCVHKKSFAWIDQMGVCYASPDGLVLVGPKGGEFVSRDYYDREDWQALDLKNRLVDAVYHDGKYVMFLQDRTVAFSPTDAPVVIRDSNIRGIYLDRENDIIYAQQGGTLNQWTTDAGNTTRMMKWRSRLHVGPGMTVNAAQVFADAPCTLILYYSMEEVDNYDASSVTKETIAVTEGMLNRPFRIRPLGIWNHWVYEIQSQGSVQEVRIGRMNEMAG